MLEQKCKLSCCWNLAARTAHWHAKSATVMCYNTEIAEIKISDAQCRKVQTSDYTPLL